jgi:hypothetical protein
MEDIEKNYMGKNIYIFSDNQAAIKVLNSSHINSN